jgi:hypothetical protein
MEEGNIMYQKAFVGCASFLAIVVLGAFPALASALPTVRENGTLVAKGSKMVGTNFGNTAFTAFDGTTDVGTITCTSSVLTGPLTANEPLVEGINWELTSASFAGAEAENKCGSTFFGAVKVTVNALPYCFLSGVAFGAFEIYGGACNKNGTLRITFVGNATCTYETAKGLPGTYAIEDNGTEATKIKLANQTLPGSAGNGPLCPEVMKFSAIYSLETDGTTTALAIHN